MNDDSINLTQLENDYLNLLILQYKGKPKIEAFLRTLIKAFLGDGSFKTIWNNFDVETAKGWFLDMIGRYVGVDRAYQMQVFRNKIYFAFGSIGKLYPKFAGGYYSIKDAKGGGEMGKATDFFTTSNLLLDDFYRFIIKMKIIGNTTRMSLTSLDANLKKFFGGDIYVDTTNNLDITYNVKAELITKFRIALSKGAIPLPIGLTLTVKVF
jgi:hypothetical protein